MFDEKELSEMTVGELVDYAQSHDVQDCSDAIVQALKHLKEFSAEEVWDRNVVRDTCRKIGNRIYSEDKDMDDLRSVYYDVLDEMGGVAARTLEHFWNGVGEWRS